ncbi:M20 family metallopeptidase [Ornithinimicrobium sediminis]|uniref:M20 family metallopeptidase n=1 Tax=Ornithinimicrobium sediminis TaxID=2904603 RepID=UPI001E4BFE10|nr:M20 family metallopeptidase [Ornithinimicrobium sediminis]
MPWSTVTGTRRAPRGRICDDRPVHGHNPETSEPQVDTAAAVAFTQELVRIRSVHEPGTGGTEAEAAALVEQRMREFGWDPRVEEVAPGRPNVVAVVDGGGGPGPTLMLEGHTDVVTEGDLDAWSFDPYAGDVVDGWLRGRGSADMKSGVAAMLYAAKAVVDDGPFPGRLVVAALVDEEGLMLGAKHFSASALAREVDGAICCEPEAGEVCAVSKGAVRLAVTFTGAMAHGAMPQHARNPLPVAARYLLAVEAVEADLLARHGVHAHLGEPYVTPTVVTGGDPDQVNVIPARAVVCLDIRTVPGLDHALLLQRLTDLAVTTGADAGVSAAVEVLDDRPPVDTSVDHPMVRALVAAHEDVTGARPAYGGVPGATDGTILTARAGIPTVVYGPGGKWIAHQADERVEVAEIARAARVYARAAYRYLHGEC